MNAFPIVNVLFAPDATGKQQVVNAVVTLSSDGPSVCLRPSGKGWETDSAGCTETRMRLAVQAVSSAMKGKS